MQRRLTYCADASQNGRKTEPVGKAGKIMSNDDIQKIGNEESTDGQGEKKDCTDVLASETAGAACVPST